MRWTRIAVVILGAAILTFAVGNMLKTLSSDKTKTAGTAIGAADIDTLGFDSGNDANRPLNAAARASEAATAKKSGPARPAMSSHKHGKQHKHKGHHAKKGLGSAAVLAAQSSPASAKGSGARANGSGANGLPMTGAPTWLAGLLGAMFVMAGIMLQLRAEDVGEVASQYQRGPALRPIESVHNGRGLRDSIRNLINRLNESPDSDFVRSGRYGR
jgi:hypothetical protein